MSSPQQPIPPHGTHSFPGPPAQPGQPNQPNQPGQPAYAAPGAPASPAGTNPLGKVALIIALVTLGLNIVLALATQLLIRTAGVAVFQIVNVGGTVLMLIGSIAALVLGVMALRRPAPHAIAGIAVGIAIAGIATTLLTVLTVLSNWMLYSF